MGSMIQIAAAAGDGSFAAYLAEPAAEVRAAIVVIQEIFGINPGIRAKCDALAAEGYLAIAPDLFWRMQPGVQLDPDQPEELKQAFDFVTRIKTDDALADVATTIRAARDRMGGGKVGVVGYCFGGKLAFLAATRTDSDATASYYGGGIDGFLGEAHGIARPLLLHFAGDDSHITPDKLATIRAALDDHPRVTIHEYPGAGHGFATQFGARRNDAAAELADARSADFFRDHLA
ncbi:MAG: carboxymethylenebutenolidase [Sphingomonas bacterium]|nr:dienelactone hydrolase family protein [Sphingomonas bacterium]MDB5689472.1 carboxymethylenebutenolidase [Sphingomonas bacterium]